MKLWLVAALWLVIGTLQAEPSQSQESPTIIPFVIIGNGAQSGIHPDTQTLTLIQNDATWQAFWVKHNTVSPPPTAPLVDFSKNMVITIIDTDQPNSGYYLSLDKAEKHGNEIWVYVTRAQPAPACMNLGMVAQPFVFATLPKMPVTTKLIFSTQMYEC